MQYITECMENKLKIRTRCEVVIQIKESLLIKRTIK